MFAQVHKFRSAVFRGLIPTRAPARTATHPTDGLVRVKSAYPVDETIDRIKKAIAAKEIPFFGGPRAAAALPTGTSNRRWPPASSTRLPRRCAPDPGHPEPAAMIRPPGDSIMRHLLERPATRDNTSDQIVMLL